MVLELEKREETERILTFVWIELFNMASDRWNVRLDQNDREMKLERIQARSGARNRAQALDTALDSYFQLERLLEVRVKEFEEKFTDLDGEATEVKSRFSIE